MNIFDFSDEADKSKYFKYKVLIYPNITWGKDLNKDSFVIVTNNIITNLDKIRNDIHWTILLPKKLECFAKDNIEQVIYPLPNYPNQMRCHFNTHDFLKIIDWKNSDFDVIYSHLPEHTLQIKNTIYNTTNLRPDIIGYSHWTEFPDITEYPMSVMNYNFLGILEMSRCGINTNAQKDLVLKYAKTSLNVDSVNKLKEIIVPQYLGWEVPVFERIQKTKKTVVFNHRPHEYKNYPWFLSMMDLMWEERKDFRVWVPLAESADRPYIDIGYNSTRYEYLSHLSGCWVGVCGRQKYAGWSVSATDGISVGVPYIFADEEYYRELAGDAGLFFKTDEEFLTNLRVILDTPHLRLDLSNRGEDRFKKCVWEESIKPFNSTFQTTFDNLHSMKSPTEIYKKILDFIKKNKSVGKSEIIDHLGWGVRMIFSGYRNLLRSEPGIRFTKNRYEYRHDLVDLDVATAKSHNAKRDGKVPEWVIDKQLAKLTPPDESGGLIRS